MAKNWGGLNNTDQNMYDTFFEKYVPAIGKADTLGGEILRAISRLVYRFYNDGDTIVRDYGEYYNSLYGANEFLLNQHIDGYVSLEYMDGDTYEKNVDANLKCVMDFLNSNPAIFNVKNSFDFMANCPKVEIDDDYDDWEEEDYDYED